MKHGLKKFLSALLAVLMLASLCPAVAFAADTTDFTATVESVNTVVGTSFDVEVSLSNNPGIAAYRLVLSYDSSLLTLDSVTYGDQMTPTTLENMSSPVKLVWYSATDVSYNGTIATLHFTAADTLTQDTATSIGLTLDDADDVNNSAGDTVDINLVGGNISIYMVRPGDINGDSKTNTKDLVRLAQYLAGWNVSVSTITADVNGDGKVNTKDLVTLAQYLSGWSVTIYPIIEPIACAHTNLQTIESKAATCNAEGNSKYYYCPSCGKYYSDAGATTEITLASTVLQIDSTNHTNIVIDKGYEPTYESTGLTDGSHCDDCGKVIIEQEPIPMLVKDTYSVTYEIAGDDEYLASQNIELPAANKTTFTADDEFYFEDVSCKGYTFKGWYDSYGNAVPMISKGTTRNIKVYAKWEKTTYHITFDNTSMGLPSTTKDYTVDETFVVDAHEAIDRYVFLGWTTDSDQIISKISAGTTGNFTLHSNWTSKRNLAIPVSSLSNPIIVEDTDEGKILFTYELGRIENVPLYTIKELPSAGGVVTVYSETTTNSISTTDASTIASTIDSITTDSTAWTLSEDWNETTHVEDSVLEQHGYDRETGSSIGKTENNTYTLTTEDYDNTVVVSNEGSVATTTQYDTTTCKDRETWESEANLTVSDTESEKYTDSASVSAELGASYGPVSAKVGAEASTSSEITSSSTASAGAKTTVAHENTTDTKTGTDKVTVEDNTKTTTSDKGVNKNESSSSASSSSISQYEAQTLSTLIAKTYSYGKSYAVGETNSQSASYSTSSGESNSYSSTLTYSNSQITTESVSYTIDGESDGSYRLVRAGIVHVFGVVIYDIATAQYSVATYDVLDDYTYTYIDYSATSAAKFDDNENGVIPFEIPYFVNDYVNGRVVCSEGLTPNPSGNTATSGAYTGSETSVIIPEYISIDNKDGTYSYATVRTLSKDTFEGNSELKSVLLSSYMREIPDSAFEGCASLQFVWGSEISSIGNNAFSGCTSLDGFKIPSTVTYIGENAFKDAKSIEVTASNPSVVLSAINSGAKNITINVSAIADQLTGVTLEIPDTVDTFELQGGRNTFSGLKIHSNAKTTILNGVTITDSGDMPLVMSSENITLNQVSVAAPNYVMLLKGTAPVVSLYGSSQLTCSSENAVVCRNVTFEAIASNIVAELNVTGNVLYYGTLNNSDLVNFVDYGAFVQLADEEEYNKYLKGTYNISLDANGGTVDTTEVTAYVGVSLGTLPTPTRDYYDFIGWFTAADGGDQVTADTAYNSADDITLYAHWTEKAVSDWVLASEVPEDAQIVSTKYTYDHKYYKTSANSEESGWTLYDTQRTGWGSTQGPVYEDPSNGVRNVWSEQYVTNTHYKTVYHYNRSVSGTGSDAKSTYATSYYSTYQEIALDTPLTALKTVDGFTEYGYYKVSGYENSLWWNQWTTQEIDYYDYGTRWYYQEPVYTYYFYQVVNEESTAEPSGSDYSNVTEWVTYRAK